MIIDKRPRRQQTADSRQQTADRISRLASRVSRLAVSQSRSFTSRVILPPRWARLLLLILTIGALSVIGATLGRGFNAGAEVVGQAVSPTIATLATPVPQLASAPPLATAVPGPAVVVVPAPPSVGIPPAAPVPLDTVHTQEHWPLLAEEHFDSVSEHWPEVRSSPSWSSDYQDGGYQMQVDSRPGISYSGPLGARDFWYSADMRITRGQAGLFFLIGRPNDFYRLLIDTDGRYQLEWQQVGVSQPLIAWTGSDALHRGEGQANQIAVGRRGDLLTLYANGVLLASYSLPAGSILESRIGLTLDAPEGGRTGLVWFDNLVVRAPKP